MIRYIAVALILFGSAFPSFGAGECCSALFANTIETPSYAALIQLGYQPRIARLIASSKKFGTYVRLRDLEIPSSLQMQTVRGISPVNIYRGVTVNKRSDYEPGGRALNAIGSELLEMYVSDNYEIAMTYATEINASGKIGYVETYQIPRALLKDGRWAGAFRLFKWELESAGFSKFNEFLVGSKEVSKPSAKP